MNKTVKGKNGIEIELTFNDDLTPGEQLQLVKKLQEFVDRWEDADELADAFDMAIFGSKPERKH